MVAASLSTSASHPTPDISLQRTNRRNGPFGDTKPLGLRAKLKDLPFACPQHGVRNHRGSYMAGYAAAARLKNSGQFSRPPPTPPELRQTYRGGRSKVQAEHVKSLS